MSLLRAITANYGVEFELVLVAETPIDINQPT